MPLNDYLSVSHQFRHWEYKNKSDKVLCLKNPESYEEIKEANVYFKKCDMCACATLRRYRSTEKAPAMEEKEMEDIFRTNLAGGGRHFRLREPYNSALAEFSCGHVA